LRVVKGRFEIVNREQEVVFCLICGFRSYWTFFWSGLFILMPAAQPDLVSPVVQFVERRRQQVRWWESPDR
jgi:hypothetical protein